MISNDVVVVGAGFAGLAMAIRLLADGRRDFSVLERATDVGGSWRANTYPGCRCDSPSHLYSFSFAPNPTWSSTAAPQPEILAYLRHCAHRFDVMRHIRLDTDVLDARWDTHARRWRLTTNRGAMVARVLVLAPGPLSEPRLPALPGLEGFAGTAFHSASWNHDHRIDGERVAVIGTGASACQFVPLIQPRVGRLCVYQRSASWVLPRSDRSLTAVERALYRRLPIAQRAVRSGTYWARECLAPAFRGSEMRELRERSALEYLRSQVQDPTLRRALTPQPPMESTRILADDYYAALSRPNVELVTDTIQTVTPRAIVTADGSMRAADTIIFATGFHAERIAIASIVHGRDGRTLEATWDGRPRAHLGVTVAGFPNLFLLVGRNEAFGRTSTIAMLESQAAYVSEALRVMRACGAETAEVRSDASVLLRDGVRWLADDRDRSPRPRPGLTDPLGPRQRAFDAWSYTLAQVPRSAGHSLGGARCSVASHTKRLKRYVSRTGSL